MDVRACKLCRKLFNYMSGPPVCPACKEAMEKKFTDVKDYVREHTHCSIQEVSEALDIPAQQIKQWVKEDRLQFSDAGSSGIFCDRCGAPIASGRFCKECNQKVVTNLAKGVELPKEEVQKTTHDTKMRFNRG